MATAPNPTKLNVGVSMLSEARDGEFSTVITTLQKILGNIIAAPTEAKYRKIRTTNPKIGQLLATRGVRAVLIGAGFVEEGEFLVLPEALSADGATAALAALAAQQTERDHADAARKAELKEKLKESQDKENEERKRMKSGIEDDAAARKEPGWKAKAAGVKEGKAITSCSDIGVGTGGGG